MSMIFTSAEWRVFLDLQKIPIQAGVRPDRLAAEAGEREEDPDGLPMTPPHPCRIVVHTAPETVTSL